MKFTIGTKKEMTQIFADDGKVLPVTLVDVSNVVIAGIKTLEKDGYNAIVLGKDIKKKANKAETQKYKELGFVPKKVVEFRVESLDGLDLTVGQKVEYEIETGNKINVIGISKGKGFAGVVKRWGFKGGPKTHGQSDRWRAPGSIGSGTTPGRVYKGKKMGGRMGGDRKTVENLLLVGKDDQYVYIKGAVPGSKESYVLIN